MHQQAKRMACVAGVFLLASSELASAKTHIETVAPELRGSVNAVQKPGNDADHPGFHLTPRIRWGNNGDGSGEWQGWLRFPIPEAPNPGYSIESATLTFLGVTNETGNPGLMIQLVPNDWGRDTIFADRYPLNPDFRVTLVEVGSHQDNPSVDISEWFDGTIAAVQPGSDLSIKVFRSISGHRRARADGNIQLELKYTKESLIAIVIPDQPSSGQNEAAVKLRMLLARAMGELPRIVTAREIPPNGLRIFVGHGPHLDGVVNPPREPEGVKILERDGDVFILGEIAPAGTNNRPEAVDRGVMHAVETFAEEVLGYRFLFSTPSDPEMFELGTVVPELAEITIEPGLQIEEAPAFQHRRLHGHPRGVIGLREGSSTDFAANHSYDVDWWARQYAEKYPEMFIPRENDASREQDAHAEAMGAQRYLNFLDYTEPLVLQKRIEHIEDFFATGSRTPFQGRVPNHKYIQEEPPDIRPPSVRYNERSRELYNPSAKPWGTFSNIWFDYMNRLAAAVEERWPEMRIATLAYYRHYGIPTFELHENVDVMLALMRSSMQNKEPDVFERNLEHLKNWSAYLGNDRDRLYLWEYWVWPGIFITPPTISPHAMQDWLQTVRPHVSGVFINGGGHPLQFQYLMYRLWLRLLWNPDLDVTAEIEDICHTFYGPAGASMAEFYHRLIERYEMAWENPELIWDQYYIHPSLYYGQSYPAPEITWLAARLEKARRETGLPAVIETAVKHGSAIYLFNGDEAVAGVSIELIATDNELVDPVFGWDDGRLVWNGRLQPGERLAISASGQAALTSGDGQVRDVSEALEGASPTLAAGGADVFHFWHSSPKRDGTFEIALRYGSDDTATMSSSKTNIYARRLAWLRGPYHVFHPTRSQYDTKQGFFAEAHVVHKHLGQPPVYRVSEVGALPENDEDPLWASVPTIELVRGRENGGTPYHNMGFPADLRTQGRMTFTPGNGLAMLLEAEGTPIEGERVTLEINGKTFEISIGGKGKDDHLLRGLQIDDNGWLALVVLEWSELGLSGDRSSGAGIPAQIKRERGDDSYIWSPPLSSPWGHGKQGPGTLVLLPL